MKFYRGFALLAGVLPTHEPFGAMPSARTPFHAGVERAEMLEFKSKHRQVDFIVGEN